MDRKINLLPIIAWCLYDWACSSFSIIIITFVFATYFTTKVAVNEVIGTYQWANATAIAGIFIAMGSPLFGAIADYGGHHKRWLLAFTYLSIVSAALLWFAFPQPSAVPLTLACLVVGTIGLEIAFVFYNAFLPTLISKEYVGRLSGWGWGCGYIGGILALVLVLLFFIQGHWHWLNPQTAAPIRIAGPFVALWYAFFSLPLFFFLPSIGPSKMTMRSALYAGCHELYKTLRKLPKEKNIFIYLIAHMIYADGLNTLFAFGGIYAAGTYGLTFEQVLLFGISMNITAGVGAILLAWMDDRLGSKRTVLFSLICLIILGVPILLLHDKVYFWLFALLLCLFVGPVQSASRSLMVKLIAERGAASTEMFGLYALSGKVTAFIGPWLLGWMTLAFTSQRVGMAIVLVFFALGALLLLPVRVQE